DRPAAQRLRDTAAAGRYPALPLRRHHHRRLHGVPVLWPLYPDETVRPARQYLTEPAQPVLQPDPERTAAGDTAATGRFHRRLPGSTATAGRWPAVQQQRTFP